MTAEEGSLNKLEDAQVRVSKSTNKARAQSGLNNAILLETSRLASDVLLVLQLLPITCLKL